MPSQRQTFQYQAPIRAFYPIPPKKKKTPEQLAVEKAESLTKELQTLRSVLKQRIEEADQKVREADEKIKEADQRIVEADQLIENTKQLIAETEVIQKGEPGESIRGEPGEPGKDAEIDEDVIVEKVLSKIEVPEPVIDEENIAKKAAKLIKIPKVKDGKPGRDAEIDHEKLGAEVVKRIENGKIKLNTKHIDGFENSVAVLRNFIARGSLHGAGDTIKAGSNITLTRNSDGTTTITSTGGSSPTTIVREFPTGDIDDSNVTFTLSQTPLTNTLDLSLGGALQTPDKDYTLSGNTITFATAPFASPGVANSVAQLLYAKYEV